jgi:hypothetical protein
MPLIIPNVANVPWDIQINVHMLLVIQVVAKMLLITLILSTGYVQVVVNMLLLIQVVVLVHRTLDWYLSPVARCGLRVRSGIPGTWV